MMVNKKNLKIRPYARLLTMLGDQLIKNERIALMEIIKNSYDADASWVKVSFNNFGDSFNILDNSTIVIEDNGCGMDSEIIEKQWLNPATPAKKKRKTIKETTPGGRVIQGDKGIGRFATLKLGKNIQVITRTEGSESEFVVDFNFSKYDSEFLIENGEEKEIFLDDLSVPLIERKPKNIVVKSIALGYKKQKRLPKGTIITISDLKGSWNENKVEAVFRDLTNLQSIFIKLPITKTSKKEMANQVGGSFDVYIYKGEIWQRFHEDYLDKLRVLLEDCPVFRIEAGLYDEKRSEFRFQINGQPKVLGLRDPEITGRSVFRRRFGNGGKVLDKRKTECGSFRFGFYIFDYSTSKETPKKYQLDKDQKKIISAHRIYLYRDGIRVYPYGEPEDDWLRIDAYRGTIAAGHFLSNDQVVGYVTITQKGNLRLRDKTNREGLIDEGDATEDFVTLIQTFLAWVRQKPYSQYRINLKNKSAQDIFYKDQIRKDFELLKTSVKGNKAATKIASKILKEYSLERDYLIRRAETTEALAGVGLSVETAAHDIMSIMGKALSSIDNLIKNIINNDIDLDSLHDELQSLRRMLSFIDSLLRNIQLLFTSSKQRRRAIRVKELVNKVEFIYRKLLKKENINLNISSTRNPLIAKTTDAVLLQVLINLFDNAIFWLKQISQQDKQIHIMLDGDLGHLVFSDNGPGIYVDDILYIFEPFYSGKGDDGRGLGLYIARQLLERHDYSIDLAEIKSEKKLSGANFVVNFIPEEK